VVPQSLLDRGDRTVEIVLAGAGSGQRGLGGHLGLAELSVQAERRGRDEHGNRDRQCETARTGEGPGGR
jgi:hypothetical protein